jgi:multiple antibiotic resistance protein
LVLLVISIVDLVHGKQSEFGKGANSGAIVPLAVPMITGPAVITVLMLQVGLYGYMVVALGLLVNFFLAWITLRKSEIVLKLMGQQGTEVFSKIAIFLMTAIAFSMIRSGIFQAIKLEKF